MPLKVVCATCKKVMGEKPGGEGVSHGLCPKCARLQTIEEVLEDAIEEKAIAYFGITKNLEETKYVLRDGTLIGNENVVHSDICSIEEIAEHILLSIDPSEPLSLEDARAKHPGKEIFDILDAEISEAFIDACPDTFLFITGAGRVVPDAGGYFFNFKKIPSMMQAQVMARALREKPSLGVEITGQPNYVYTTFQQKLSAEAILKKLESESLNERANLRGTTGKVPNLTSPKELERLAFEKFGEATKPSQMGFVFPDGRALNLEGRNHLEVSELFNAHELDFVINKPIYRRILMEEFMVRTGAVQVLPEKCMIVSPVLFLTKHQSRTVETMAFSCAGSVLVEAWRWGNPRSKFRGYYVAGGKESADRFLQRMEEHPERFGLDRIDLVWGLGGLGGPEAHGIPHLGELSQSKLEALEKRAIEEFGTTDDIRCAGYILEDGTMLDFCNLRDGGTPGIRARDHREIEAVMPRKVLLEHEAHYSGRTHVMWQWMKDTGAVRFSPEGPGASFPKKPTFAQVRTIVRNWRRNWKTDPLLADVWIDGNPNNQATEILRVVDGDQLRADVKRLASGETNDDEDLGQLPKVGEGDLPAALAVKTHGLAGAVAQGHDIPHLNGPTPKSLHFFAQGLKNKAEHTTDIDETAFILTDGTQIGLGDASSHQDVLFDNLPRKPHPGELLNPAQFIQRTGSVRVVHGMGRVFFEAGRIPTPAQTKVILDAHASGRTGDVLELEFVDKKGEFVTYQDDRPSEKRMRFFFNKHRESLLQGLEMSDIGFEQRWEDVVKSTFAPQEDANDADWILKDGTAVQTHGHSQVCWTLDDSEVLHAMEEEILDWYGFWDDLDIYKQEEPDRSEEDIRSFWLQDLHSSDRSNEWCEERFIDATGAIRHASVAYEGSTPAFELHDLPSPAQAKRIAEIIESRRPRFFGDAEFYFNGRFIKLEFPARASAASVIAKLERAWGIERDDEAGLGELEQPIEDQIVALVEELINQREEPKIDAVKRAADDLKERIEKLADKAGVKVRFAEGIEQEDPIVQGLIAVSELEEKVNLVALRPPTSEERAQWEEDKLAIARAEERRIENPFSLGDGKLISGIKEHINETLDMLEIKMRDKSLDWLESLGNYPSHIKINLHVYDRPGIRAFLEVDGNEEMPLEEITWSLTLSSEFPMMVGDGYQNWKSEEMTGVKAGDINLVMKRLERPLDSLLPQDPWPIGMIENFNNAWDAYAGEQNDWRRNVAENPLADPGMSQLFLHTKVAGTAWNLAALYVPFSGDSNWFAAELVSTDASKVKIPDFENIEDLVAPHLSEEELDKLSQDVGLTNTVYISQDWPLVIQPHFWNLKGPGLLDLSEAFSDSIGRTDKEIVRAAFEVGHATTGLRASYGDKMSLAEDFPVLVERMVCTAEAFAKMERPVGEALNDWKDVRATTDDLLMVIERSYYKRTDTSPRFPMSILREAFLEIVNSTCNTDEAVSFLKRQQRPTNLREKYKFNELIKLKELEFFPRPMAPGFGDTVVEDLEGLGDLPSPSDIVTSIVAHLQAIANGRLEINVAKGQDEAIDSLLRSIRTFATRLRAACSCDTGFEWCCPSDRRVLPSPTLGREDEANLADIRVQLRRLGGYAEEGIEVTPLVVSGRKEILLKLADRAGQFTYRGAPRDIRNQLSNMSVPPDTVRVWRDNQIRSFWYVLASNDRFKLDEEGWKFALEAPLEFFGAQFFSRNKKHHGLVLTNYEWAITSSQFFYDRPDTIIHINTGLSSKAFLPFPIFDLQKEIDPKVQLAIMRCIVLEVNSMVPNGQLDEVKVLKHIMFGSEKVTGKIAETFSNAVDNISSSCRQVVDTLPSQRRRSVTFKGLHGMPGCLLGPCEVKNG